MDKTPLHLATELGNLDEVQRLIKGGADINARDCYGSTALHNATYLKHMEVTKYLLAQGADVNSIQWFTECSPLHSATFNNDLEMIRLFTATGADMERSDTWGKAPIHIAVEKGYLEIVKYFLKNGVYVDIINEKSKMTPLLLAAERGYIEIVDYLLLYKANMRLKDNYYKRSAIHFGVTGGNVKIVKILIEKGVNVNAKDIFKLTPLHLAYEYRYLEIVQLLLKNGAMRNIQVANYSLLHQACETGCLEMIKCFISAGVDANFGTIKEYTILHVACKYGRIEMVKYLVSIGADVNKKTLPNGATPLYFAIKNMCSEVAEFLILNGADLKEAEYKGKSALSIALKDVSSDYPESEQTEQYMVVAKLIIKYTLLICNPNEKYIQDGCPFFKVLSQYYNDCQKEITSMRSVTIKNSTVSLYQIICDSNKGNAFVRYLCNDNIKNELQNIEDYLKDFSIYGNILPLVQLRIKNGFQRKELLSDADLIMKKMAPKLPSELRWKVFDYLSITDIKIVIQSDLFKCNDFRGDREISHSWNRLQHPFRTLIITFIIGLMLIFVTNHLNNIEY